MELTIGNILIMSGILGVAVVCIVVMQAKPTEQARLKKRGEK